MKKIEKWEKGKGRSEIAAHNTLNGVHNLAKNLCWLCFCCHSCNSLLLVVVSAGAAANAALLLWILLGWPQAVPHYSHI